jgi:hypothetical protein
MEFPAARSCMAWMACTAMSVALVAGTARAEEAAKKNWTAPAGKIYAQTLADETMAQHPELLSMTFHGVPPGLQDVYTMFAGSYPERIGNPDDPDDIDVIRKGITILDPRWHRTKDKDRKFVVQMPLRDAAGANVGLIVYAFRNPTNPSTSSAEMEYLGKAAALRDALAKRIPSYEKLFDASH